MDEAAADHTTAASLRPQPRRERLALNRRQRRELIRQNQRLADEAQEAQTRPGSNTAPPTAAELADYRLRVHALITTELDRAQITRPGERHMLEEVLTAGHMHEGGGNDLDTALWALTAIVRFHDAPGSLLRIHDALASVRIVLNALRDARDGQPETFLALLPQRKKPATGGAPTLENDGILRALAAAGVWGMWTGPRTQKAAATLVSEAFEKAGISITEGLALKHFKRVRNKRKRDATEVIDQFNELTADARNYPLPEREKWLARLADAGGRILGR